jgi:hypothetical protein
MIGRSVQRTARGDLIAIVVLCCVCSALPAGAVDAAHLIRPGVGHIDVASSRPSWSALGSFRSHQMWYELALFALFHIPQ